MITVKIRDSVNLRRPTWREKQQGARLNQAEHLSRREVSSDLLRGDARTRPNTAPYNWRLIEGGKKYSELYIAVFVDSKQGLQSVNCHCKADSQGCSLTRERR